MDALCSTRSKKDSIMYTYKIVSRPKFESGNTALEYTTRKVQVTRSLNLMEGIFWSTQMMFIYCANTCIL